MMTNLRYADDIILWATLEAELQELVDHLDRVSRRYSLLINIDKTKVMASDGIACRILIQNSDHIDYTISRYRSRIRRAYDIVAAIYRTISFTNARLARALLTSGGVCV